MVIIVVVIINKQCPGLMYLMAARMGTRSLWSASFQVWKYVLCAVG